MKKKLLCTILAASMVLSMAACGNEPANKESESKESSVSQESVSKESSAEQSTATPEPEPEKIEKFDPPITITSVRKDVTSGTQNYKEGESVENNVWIDLYKEKYGIEVKYEWIAANTADFNTKKNLMFAENKITDILEIANQTELQQVVEAGLVQPLDEVWELYASDLTKQVIAEAGDTAMEACKVDGKLMAVPFVSASRESSSLLYIRQDWLDNLGLKAPETMQDVLDICVAFATQDPDKDGKQDTYALELNSTITGTTLPIFNANGWYNGWYTNEKGELTDGKTEEGYKKTLQLLREWIEKGYVHPEWATMNATKSKELVINGQIGVRFGSYSDPISTYSKQRQLEPGTEWMVMAIPDWEGDPLTQFYKTPIGSYWVVSKDCEHPEAMIMMLNEFVEKFYFSSDAETYYKYVTSEKGANVYSNSHVRTYRSLKNAEMGKRMEEYYSGKITKDQLNMEALATVAQIDAYNAGDDSMWQWNKVFGPGQAASCLWEYIDADAFEYVIHWGVNTDAEVTYSTMLSDYHNEFRNALLNGTKSFDEWDDYAKTYRSMGYEEMVKEIKEKYNLK